MAMSNIGRSSDADVRSRRELVLQRVLELGQIEIRALADELDVSLMTMHRDLDALTTDGLILKERGRAIAPPALLVQTSARFRLRTSQAVKQSLAEAAMSYVRDATTVFVDDSTSCIPVLERLTGREPRAVVTNYLRAARTAAGVPGVTAHLLDGRYDPELDAVFGASTVEAVRRWHADVAVLGAPAVKSGRIYHPLADSLALKKSMMDNADRRVLLVDHTKFGHTAANVLGSAADIDLIVTDSGTPASEVDALRHAGAEVIVVDATN